MSKATHGLAHQGASFLLLDLDLSISHASLFYDCRFLSVIFSFFIRSVNLLISRDAQSLWIMYEPAIVHFPS